MTTISLLNHLRRPGVIDMSAVTDSTLVTDPAKESLNKRQLADYRSHRRECLRWLLNLGKDPYHADGQAFEMMRARTSRGHLLSLGMGLCRLLRSCYGSGARYRLDEPSRVSRHEKRRYGDSGGYSVTVFKLFWVVAQSKVWDPATN